MFSENQNKYNPKIIRNSNLPRLNYFKGQIQHNLPLFQNHKNTHSRSPENHKFDYLPPSQKKKLRRTPSRLFEAAHLPTAGQTYIRNTPSKTTELLRTNKLKRTLSSEDTRIAESLKKRKMIIKSQYEIKLGGEPTLSDIIGNFDAEGNESILAQVKQLSAQMLKIDSYVDYTQI